MPKETPNNNQHEETIQQIKEQTWEEYEAELQRQREKSQSEAYPNYPQYPVDGNGLRTDLGLSR